MYIGQSQSPNSSYSPYPLDVHIFVLYVCVCISALPICSSVSLFWLNSNLQKFTVTLPTWSTDITGEESFMFRYKSIQLTHRPAPPRVCMSTCSVAKSCPILYNPMDCSLPSSSIPTSVGWQSCYMPHTVVTLISRMSQVCYLCTRLGLMIRMKATFCVSSDTHPRENPGLLFGLCWR